MPFSGSAYDDKTLALMLSAFERARVLVGASKQMPCELSRAIAGAIMYAVDEGERNPEKLTQKAVDAFQLIEDIDEN
jgi:hypothetical protein